MRTHAHRKPTTQKVALPRPEAEPTPAARVPPDLAHALRFAPRLADIPERAPDELPVQRRAASAPPVQGAVNGVVQRTVKGAVAGGAVGAGLGWLGAGLLASNPVGWGITGGLLAGAALGHLFTRGKQAPPTPSPLPVYDRSSGIQPSALDSGTYLYHGTRWREGTPKWWGAGKYPNKEGEDGGISFTLRPEATPKVKNADVILVYQLTKQIPLLMCPTKGDFYKQLRRGSACYTPTEQEVVFQLADLASHLRFVQDYPGEGSAV